MYVCTYCIVLCMYILYVWHVCMIVYVMCVCVCLRIYVFVYVCVHYVCMMFVLMCTCKIICKVVVAAPIVNNGEQTRDDKVSSDSGKTRTEASKRE